MATVLAGITNGSGHPGPPARPGLRALLSTVLQADMASQLVLAGKMKAVYPP